MNNSHSVIDNPEFVNLVNPPTSHYKIIIKLKINQQKINY